LALERLNWLDGILQNKTFIAGETYAMVDITILPWLDFSRVIHLKPFVGRDHLKR
jgi:glutathione S-transferase